MAAAGGRGAQQDAGVGPQISPADGEWFKSASVSCCGFNGAGATFVYSMPG